MSYRNFQRGLLGASTAIALVISSGQPAGSATDAANPDLKRSLLSGATSIALVADRLQSRQTRRAAPQNASRPDTVPGVLVVKFAEGLSERQVARAISTAGGVSGRSLPYADFAVVTLADGVDVVDAAARAAAESGVVYAEPLARRYASYPPERSPVRVPVEPAAARSRARLGHQHGCQQRRRRRGHRQVLRKLDDEHSWDGVGPQPFCGHAPG